MSVTTASNTKPAIRQPTVTEPGTLRMGVYSSAEISISGSVAQVSPRYSTATRAAPPASTQRRERPRRWVSNTTAMCEPCWAASTTPDMMIQGNISSGSSDANAKLVPET